MSDKKVERHSRSSESERPVAPSAASNRQGSEPEPTAANQAKDGAASEAKTALLDKFREREERLRREEQAADQKSDEAGGESSGEG